MTDIIAQLEVEKSTLLSTIVEKDGLIAQQGSVIVEKDGLIATYKQQLAELRRMIYGTKSERVTDESKPGEAAAAEQSSRGEPCGPPPLTPPYKLIAYGGSRLPSGKNSTPMDRSILVV